MTKFKYLLEAEEPLNEGLLSWIKSRWRDPEDYYDAIEPALRRSGYLPMWREKWLNKVTGDGEGVRYGNLRGETIRVQMDDMGGDMESVLSISYSKNGSLSIDEPDSVCVFNEPANFNEVFPEVEKALASGKKGEYELSTGDTCVITNSAADKFNSFEQIYNKFNYYLNQNRTAFSTTGMELRRAIEQFYAKEGFSFGGNTLSWKDKLAIKIASFFGSDVSLRWATVYAEILREDSLGPFEANKLANVMSKGWRD